MILGDKELIGNINIETNVLNRSGNFEPPGARAVNAFVAQHDKVNDPRWMAVKIAQQRAEAAEKLAAENAGKLCLLCPDLLVFVTTNLLSVHQVQLNRRVQSVRSVRSM